MSSEGYTNPFSICFTSLKIRYNEYDKTIDSLNFLSPTDKVNVFINLESVLTNLSTVKDIGNKLLLERNFPTILTSNVLNLAAHYKRFFRSYNLDTTVYLYYTDLSNYEYNNTTYNEDYRSFYRNKYLSNPNYQLLGNKWTNIIIPTAQQIAEFIPNVHVIRATNGIEGSLIPMIIANKDENAKNFIVSNEKYDSQYLLYPDKFCLHYIKKSPAGCILFNTFEKYISDLFKENMNECTDIGVFKNTSIYSVLLSTIGDRNRSIEPIKGIGSKTTSKLIKMGIENGLITNETTSIELLKSIFQNEVQEEVESNFNCIDLNTQIKRMSEDQIFSILNQVVNRSDIPSLEQLNETHFINYPLMLQELIN